jgi:hypothetical protein
MIHGIAVFKNGSTLNIIPVRPNENGKKFIDFIRTWIKKPNVRRVIIMDGDKTTEVNRLLNNGQWERQDETNYTCTILKEE